MLNSHSMFPSKQTESHQPQPTQSSSAKTALSHVCRDSNKEESERRSAIRLLPLVACSFPLNGLRSIEWDSPPARQRECMNQKCRTISDCHRPQARGSRRKDILRKGFILDGIAMQEVRTINPRQRSFFGTSSTGWSVRRSSGFQAMQEMQHRRPQCTKSVRRGSPCENVVVPHFISKTIRLAVSR